MQIRLLKIFLQEILHLRVLTVTITKMVDAAVTKAADAAVTKVAVVAKDAAVTKVAVVAKAVAVMKVAVAAAVAVAAVWIQNHAQSSTKVLMQER